MEVGSAFVSVLPSAKGFGSKLQQQVGPEVDSSGKATGRRFGTAMKVGLLALGGAALGAGALIKGAISDASDLAESESKVGVVFGKSAGQIMAASRTSATAMGLSKQAYLEATGTFGNLLVSLDLGPSKAAAMSQQMVKLAGDLASFNNVSPEEALDALRSGLTGETEPLKKFGVNMNETTLRAQALKMGLVKTTKEALTPQNKALAAQALIMEQTKTAQGDFARTSGGLANQQRILSATFANSKASLGKIFLPLAIRAVTLINKGFATIGPVVDRVKASFANFTGGGGLDKMVGSLKANVLPTIHQLATIFETVVLPAVAHLAASLKANFLPVLRTMGTTFSTVILPALQRFGAYVIANVVPIFAQFANIVATKVVPVIATLARFIYGQLVPAVIKIVSSIATSLRPVFDALFAQIQTTVLPIVTKLLAKFREWWPTISRVIVIVLKVIGVILILAAKILGVVLPPLIRLTGFLLRNVVGAVLAVIGVMVTIIGKLIDFGTAVVNGGKKVGEFATKVSDKIGDAVGYVKDLPKKAEDALGDVATKLKDKGRDLIQGLIDGILDKLKDLGKAMGKIGDKIKGFLPGSPIKEGPLVSWNRGGAGKRLVDQGIISGLDARGGALSSSMTRLTRRISAPSVAVTASQSGPVTGRTGAVSGGNTFNIYEAISPSATAHETARRLAFAGGA